MEQPTRPPREPSPLPALLRAIASARRSGTLTVRGARGSKKVFFQEGKVLAVASADPAERLGHYLIGWGHVTPRQLGELLEEQRAEARGLGELAVARRLLDREEMVRLLRIRAEDALFDLARWEEGDLRFAAGLRPVRGYVDLALDVEAFLERLDELLSVWRRFNQRVPDARDVPRVVPVSDFATLSVAEAGILQQIDGRRSLGQVALLCRTSQLEVVTVLQIHARGGLIEFVRPVAAVPPLTAAPWRETLREAESSLTYGDLLEAYDLLCRALTSGDTSRDHQEEALAVEERIRAAITVDDGAILAPADGGGVEARLSGDEEQLLALFDGTRTVAEVLRLAGGDDVRNRILVHSLTAHGLLSTTV